MGRRLIISALVVVISAGASQVSSQESGNDLRVLARTRGNELIAEIPNRTDWCQPDLTFTIRGQDDSSFKEGEVDGQGRQGRFLLQRLLGVIRVGLQSECPQAKSITFNGFVDGEFIYRGYAAKNDKQGDWVLIEIPVNLVNAPEAPPPAAYEITPQSATQPPRIEAVVECDRLASHPNDPGKPDKVKGVLDNDIQAGRAAETCEEALLVEPDNPRLMYQLARAYLIFGKTDDGLDLMIEAAEEEYGPAIASLGDFALYGVLDDDPDPETAKALYERAAQLGFVPAAKLAKTIEVDPEEDKSQEVQSKPNYYHPERLQTLLTGNVLPGHGDDFLRAIAYSSSVMSGIISHCPEAGVDISEQQIVSTVSKRMSQVNAFFGLAAIGEGALSNLQQEGMDDGYALAITSGCSSSEVEAIHRSLRRTFLG